VSGRNGSHVIGTAADFPPGTHRVVAVGRRRIGVFNIGGRLFGLPDRCPHQGGPLCEGRRPTGTLRADAATGWRLAWVHDGEVIACPWHGLEFHVPSGRCLAYPEIVLRRYEVTVKGDDVVLWTERGAEG
jgi:nitrite reductase (NADH) small subunit